MQIPSVLKNKYVKYAVMALAAINVLGYLSVKSYECLALFGLSAYSANCYCKNMTCALLAGLFVANFVFGCSRVAENFAPLSSQLEGLANKCAEKAENDCTGDCEWDKTANKCISAAQDAADNEEVEGGMPSMPPMPSM
jgi:hypothetical protein